MIAYRFLREDGTSVFTSDRWELPDAGPAGWVEAPADPCRSGIHACRVADLPLWIGRAPYEMSSTARSSSARTRRRGSRGASHRPRNETPTRRVITRWEQRGTSPAASWSSS